MNLKTSFFNKSIFKSDIKRFWWIGGLETLILMLTAVMPLYNHLQYNDYYYRSYDMPMWNANIMWFFVFAVTATTLLFTYLHFASSVSTLHGMPVKRTTLYFTKLIAGGILTFLPIIITGLVLYLITREFPDFTLIEILKWIFVGCLYTFFFISLTCAVNKVTGHPVGTIIFTIGFFVLPVIIFFAYEGICQNEIFGFSGNNDDFYMNILYPSEDLLTEPLYFIPYILFSVGLVFLGFYFYQRRNLENYGEVIAFGWLKPVFIAIVAIIASVFSYSYFVDILNKEGIWWIIPLGAVGTVIAWMISKKSIKLNGIQKPVLIYLASALIFCVVIEFDLTAYERRVPKLSEVKSVKVARSREYWDDDLILFDEGGEKLADRKGEITDFSFTQEEDIKNVIKLHKYIIEKRNEITDGEYLPIEYTLKNGKSVKREYFLDYDLVKEYLKPLFETKQMRAKHYPIIDGGEREFNNIAIYDKRIKNHFLKTFYSGSPEMQKLLDAILKDMNESTYEEMREEEKAMQILIEYRNLYDWVEGASKAEIEKAKKDHSEFGLNVVGGFENTVNVLKEIGVYDLLPKASDIENIHICVYNRKPGTEKQLLVNEFLVKDATEIEAIYALCDSMNLTQTTVSQTATNMVELSYVLKDGHEFDVSCYYDDESLPEVFKKYFK